MINAYVDGSYSSNNEKIVGWAFVIENYDKPKNDESIINSQIIKSGYLQGDVTAINQVGGELKSLMMLLEWLQWKKISDVAIHYDYAGLKKWLTGEWKAKNKFVKQGVKHCKKILENSNINITWVKVSPNDNKADIEARKITGGKNRHS